jgi:tRNA(fMet)-specific endonuclease VapC
MGVIIDSSVLIAAERGRLDWVGWQDTLRDEQQSITVITLSELWHGWHRAQNQEQRSRRERFIRSIEDRFPILAIGVAEARVHARLWSELSVAGKLIGAHDLLIAAVALANGHKLATLNRSEFARIAELQIADIEAFVKI